MKIVQVHDGDHNLETDQMDAAAPALPQFKVVARTTTTTAADDGAPAANMSVSAAAPVTPVADYPGAAPTATPAQTNGVEYTGGTLLRNGRQQNNKAERGYLLYPSPGPKYHRSVDHLDQIDSNYNRMRHHQQQQRRLPFNPVQQQQQRQQQQQQQHPDDMVYPKYEDHLATLPMAAEIRALRRIQSTENFANIRNDLEEQAPAAPAAPAHFLNTFSGRGTLQRHQSVKEPMMSMVPEEASSIHSSSVTAAPAPNNKDVVVGDGDVVDAKNSRTFRTLSKIRTVGTVNSGIMGGSVDAGLNNASIRHQQSLDRRFATAFPKNGGVGGILKDANNNVPAVAKLFTNGTLNGGQKRAVRTNNNNGNSEDGAIFSRGNSIRSGINNSNTLPRAAPKTTRSVPGGSVSPVKSDPFASMAGSSSNRVREDGDGSEDFEGQQTVEFPPDYSDDDGDDGEDDDGVERSVPGFVKAGDAGRVATVYRVGSAIDLGLAKGQQDQVQQRVPRLTEDLNRCQSEGALLFDQADSGVFGDLTALPESRSYGGGLNSSSNNNNGSTSNLANGNGGNSNMKHWLGSGGGGGWGLNNAKQNNHYSAGGGDDKQSTLSRYWTMDRSLQRRLQKTNYQHIKRLCRDRGQLFEDSDFPTTNRSIYKNKKPPLHPITWLRPHEICQRPKFIAEGATRFDVEQGEQGDPWLLAAVSSLTLTPRFLDRVVPPDQNFEHGYCGVFRFRFWHFGDWVEVLVDDKLPTYKGRLVYMHSTDPSEFWAALLEKAYAKLYGSYESLHQGFTTKALQDLTGGIVQSFSLSSQDRLLTYQVLNSAVPRSTLLIASINIDNRGHHDSKRQLRLRNGLITRHAYSVTGLARVRGQLGDTHLVRLRNPWGKGEWNGPWSERSWEWDSLSDRDKELLSARVRNEGEFWMAFDDFAKQFSHLDLVHIGPDDWMSESALHSKKPWRAVLARRRWRAGYNAGGSPQHMETTAMNPQFHIQIPRTNNVKCHVVVSVTQQYETNQNEGGTRMSSSDNKKSSKKKKRKKLHHIGFAVYEVPPHMTRLTPLYVAEHQPLDVTNHSVAREVVTFFTLPPGDYIVVPQTNVPNCDGKFLLRILTDEQSNIWEVNEDNMLFRNVLAEFEESFKYSESRILLSKLVSKYPPEIDASVLQKILKGHWKSYLLEKPSLELCKSLVMLRDYNISGRINLMEIPLLLHMLQFWRNAFVKYIPGSGSSAKSSSFNLRLILWEAGITVSNKVLECLVLRFAKNRNLSAESYVTVMVRLHLAHERYHSIDTKMKGNPLSLEEMILMTIYS